MRGTKRIDWLNHFLEFIVVVIGILLAFQLNTCRDDSKEQAVVNQHINSIIEETELNKGSLEASLAQTEALLTTADTLIVAIERKDPMPKIGGLSMRMLGLNYTYYKKNAYNSLVATGDIRFINDFKLKEEIIGLYEFYNWAEGLETMTRNTFTEYFFPFAMENLDMNNGNYQDRTIYDNKKYLNIISTYRYTLKARKQKQEETLDLINQFLENRSLD